MDSVNYISREALRAELRRLLGRAYVPEAGSPAARMASQRGEPLPCSSNLGGGRVLGTNPVRTWQVATIPMDSEQRRGSAVGIATGGLQETSAPGCAWVTTGPTECRDVSS